MAKRLQFEKLDASVQSFLTRMQEETEPVLIVTEGKPLLKITLANEDVFGVYDEVWQNTRKKKISAAKEDRAIAEALKATTGRKI